MEELKNIKELEEELSYSNDEDVLSGYNKSYLPTIPLRSCQ
jgi:hypothetical protein